LREPISYRAVVSTFDASLRCVRANLGIAVVPREVAEPMASTYGLRVLPLTDPWAQRRFAICCYDEKPLSPAAKALAAHLHSLATARQNASPRRRQGASSTEA
jgi:DNA-binding transcriptional LysR family regulator